jgi:hypothetical protein
VEKTLKETRIFLTKEKDRAKNEEEIIKLVQERTKHTEQDSQGDKKPKIRFFDLFVVSHFFLLFFFRLFFVFPDIFCPICFIAFHFISFIFILCFHNRSGVQLTNAEVNRFRREVEAMESTFKSKAK